MKRIIVLLMLLSSPTIIYSQNLIVNPGFESLLSSWIYFGSEPLVSTVVAENAAAHSGSYGCRVASRGTGAANTAIAQIVPLQAGHKYLMEYWVKSDSVGQYMLPIIKFRNDTNLIFESYMLPVGIQADWIKMSNRFTAPDSTDNFLFGMILLGPGKLWFDDFSLVELTDTLYREYSVVINQQTTDFKSLFSTNNGPGNPSHPSNHIMKFQEMGLDDVRTHDYSIAFDYHAVFPDTSRNPLDSTAYHFFTTDSCIADILNAGGHVYYRLGESYDISHTYNAPPANAEKFAQVCLQIIKHYNDGWNNGFHYNLNRFEIWNEPDIPDFWSGTVQQYIKLYRLTSRKIKMYDPGIQVGGPAISNIFNSSFMHPFLDSVVNEGLPLDFFSYHLYYYPNPYYYQSANEYARARLNEHGLTSTELYNSEWNPFMFSFTHFNAWGMDDALNAATTVGAMKYLQNSTIDKLFRYATDNYWFGLVDWNDQYRYSGYTYRAMQQLMHNHQQLMSTGSDSLGSIVMAGRSPFGDEIQVLVADNSSSSHGYRLNFDGLQTMETYFYSLFRIDSCNKYFITSSGIIDAAHPYITQKVEAPFCDHIILSKVVGMPGNSHTPECLVQPNPFFSSFGIDFYLSENSEIQLCIYDLSGKLIYAAAPVYCVSGQNKIEWYESCLADGPLKNGMYLIELKSPERVLFRQKLLKLKN